MKKESFVIEDAKGYIEKVYYEFCNGRSAKIKIEDKLNGKVWYFPTGGNGYNHLLNIISSSITRFTDRAENIRDNIFMYEKRGNRWVEIDNTKFYRSTELFNNILITQ